MQDLITKKVDAIVITAASPTNTAPVVEEAAGSGDQGGILRQCGGDR